jgi:ATP-binding cassette subfamily B protein
MRNSTTRSVLRFVDHPRRSITALVAASVVAGFAEGAAILIVVRVAVEVASDTVSSNFVPFATAPTGSGTAVAIAAACALVTLVAHLVIAEQSALISGQVLTNTRSNALRAFSTASWPAQSKQRLGALQETVSTLSLLTSTFAQILTTGVANLIMLVMFMAIALAVNPIGMLIVSLAGALVFMLIRPLSTRIREASTEFASADTNFAEETTNFAASAMELRSFGVSEVACGRLERDLREVSAKQRSVRFKSALGTSVYRDVAVLLLVGSVGILTVIDANAVGSASAVVVLVVRALASAHAVNAAVQFSSERAATVELLVARIEALEHGREATSSRPLDSIASFELESVAYAYPGGASVLHDVSFSIRRGEILGIAGPSGSGKTTLLQVLLRLRRPTSGMVLVNGHDYQSYLASDWARHIAYVPQEPTLFEGTIADNISFYREVPASALLKAAADAHIRSEIERLPGGFHTGLGPGGSGLSGGQKQRVAIARALVGSPEVVIMDEPSSALDPQSELLLRETIRDIAENAAVVIVAHRETTLSVCDRVLTLDNGHMRKTGLVDSELSHPDGTQR